MFAVGAMQSIQMAFDSLFFLANNLEKKFHYLEWKENYLIARCKKCCRKSVTMNEFYNRDENEGPKKTSPQRTYLL